MSYDCTTALEPGQQSKTLPQKKKKGKERKRKAQCFLSMKINLNQEMCKMGFTLPQRLSLWPQEGTADGGLGGKLSTEAGRGWG